MIVAAVTPLLIPLAFGEPDALLHTDDAYVAADAAAAHSGATTLAPGDPITDPSWDPVPMGVGHEPGAVTALDTATVLFVNFDGPMMVAGCGNDSRMNCSTIFGGTQFNPSPADPATRAAVIQSTRADVEDFGVIVVGERPPQGNPYAMVVVGTPVGGAPNGVGGVAPGIDCGNNNPNITSFSFLDTAGSNVQATVIHQEAAHTWGLEHVDDSTDNLFPSAGGNSDPKYRDVCSQVVSNTALDPSAAQCNQIHTMFCESNFQNSYQEMLALFGGPILDVTSPTVIIDNPLDGQTLDYEEDFDLTVTLDDDRRPQIMVTRIIFDGVEAASTTFVNSTVSFGVPGGDAPAGHGWANGEHTIRVEVEDESGNPAAAEIVVNVAGNPAGGGDEGAVDETAGSDDDGNATGDGTGGGDTGINATGDPVGFDDGGDDGGCSCSTTERGPMAGMLALLGLLGWRRRRD